jgi:excisionase family DNA binding protein
MTFKSQGGSGAIVPPASFDSVQSENGNPEQWLSLKEAASYLRLSTSTLYKKVANREITFYSPSKRLWFKKSDLDAYRETHRNPSKYEIPRSPASIAVPSSVNSEVRSILDKDSEKRMEEIKQRTRKRPK